MCAKRMTSIDAGTKTLSIEDSLVWTKCGTPFLEGHIWFIWGTRSSFSTWKHECLRRNQDCQMSSSERNILGPKREVIKWHSLTIHTRSIFIQHLPVSGKTVLGALHTSSRKQTEKWRCCHVACEAGSILFLSSCYSGKAPGGEKLGMRKAERASGEVGGRGGISHQWQQLAVHHATGSVFNYSLWGKKKNLKME